MTPLLSSEGDSALAALAREKTIYGFDFDGTLAPIVSRPEAAFASDATHALLTSLASIAPVAILTGRSVADVRRRLAFEPRYVVGNHGAEGLPDADSDDVRREDLRITRAWRTQWSEAWSAIDGDDGVEVEDKGRSLSIHWRNARDVERAASGVATAIDVLDPKPHVIEGKAVANLMPSAGVDKGTALAALVSHAGCSHAFYIGDDVTDELAFAAAGPDWVTVRVGRSVSSAARFYVEGQDDVDACLARIVEFVRTRGPR